MLSLVLILLTSGCTGFGNIFGTTEPAVKELPPDVITVKNINVIPSQALNPSDQFTVYYEVQNQDDKDMVDVTYQLYDDGLCSLADWTGGADSADPASGNPSLGSLSPGETRLIQWTFNAPHETEMAGLSVTCPIRFKISYDYEAKSQIDAVVIGSDKLSEMQRSGESVFYTPSLSVGRGPLKIYFDFGSTLPVKEGTTLPVYIKIQNVGEGLYESIPQNALTIKAPDFGTMVCDGAYFPDACTGTCTNTERDIPLIKKTTTSIRCTLTAPDIDDSIEKTYYISASFKYDYDVYGKATVEINP